MLLQSINQYEIFLSNLRPMVAYASTAVRPNTLQLGTLLASRAALLGKPSNTNSAFFFNIVQTAFDPPLVLNMHVANFFDRLLKKCVNVCRDNFWQNNIRQFPLNLRHFYPEKLYMSILCCQKAL